MIDPRPLQLALQGNSIARYRPNLERPFSIKSIGDHRRSEPGSQQRKSFAAVENLRIIAQRLAWPHRTGRLQIKVPGVALVLRIAAVTDAISQGQQSDTPALHLIQWEQFALGVELAGSWSQGSAGWTESLRNRSITILADGSYESSCHSQASTG